MTFQMSSAGRTAWVLNVALLASLGAIGCKDKPKEPAPAASATTAPRPSTESSTKVAASTSAAPSGSAKGSSDDTSASLGAGGPTVEGVVVMKSHELPAATKPIADFKPSSSGFKFQNYGNKEGYVNLTITEARRMFGDQVCGSIDDGKCTLTPVAARWIEQSNKEMGGGHCEGFAALALLMERGQIDPKLFGAATVPELEIKDNEKLQREIAYWFITQGVMPMATAEDKSLTPVQVAEKIEAMTKGGETYTLGFYAPGYKMGHATTPYAVVDKGDTLWLMHYDNNYPGQEKHIEIDKKANTWVYTTAADPDAAEHAYKGDASTKTLTIAPTSVRTGPLVCHFCGAVDAPGADKGAAKGSAASVEKREIGLSGDANLLITDEAGHHLGYVDGKLVNAIDGASFSASKSGDEAHEDEPIYFLPTGKKLKVTVDGTSLTKASTSSVTLFGKGYTMAVEDILLAPGQKDEIEFSADWSTVTYTTKKAETPTLLIGIETTGADYLFEVKVLGETAGQTVILSIDLKKGTFGVKVKGDDATSKPTLTIEMHKIDKGGLVSFKHSGIAISADQSVSFDYAAWKGNKTPLHASVLDAKGKVLSEMDESDED